MKVIHTADWHLGKILNGKQFLEDQHYILNKLIDNLKEEKPDVLVISVIYMIRLILVRRPLDFLKKRLKL